MSKTIVVNIKTDKYDVYIGRATKDKDGYFGNPYVMFDEGERAECIEKYRVYFHQRMKVDSYFRQAVLALRGKRLGCFCKPKLKCHGDVIADYLNSLSKESEIRNE